LSGSLPVIRWRLIHSVLVAGQLRANDVGVRTERALHEVAAIELALAIGRAELVVGRAELAQEARQIRRERVAHVEVDECVGVLLRLERGAAEVERLLRFLVEGGERQLLGERIGRARQARRLGEGVALGLLVRRRICVNPPGLGGFLVLTGQRPQGRELLLLRAAGSAGHGEGLVERDRVRPVARFRGFLRGLDEVLRELRTRLLGRDGLVQLARFCVVCSRATRGQ
jgi:hypothetical protein